MTDVLVKPAFQSALSDSGDVTRLGPTFWNASRLFSAGTAGDLVVRDAASATGASWSTALTLTSLTVNGNVSLNGSTIFGATQLIFWNGRSILNPPADGQLNLTNNAQSAGVGFDVVTDAVLKVRTRAQSGYATVDALGYKVSGVAGVAAFGPAHPASITIVNGLVTAVS